MKAVYRVLDKKEIIAKRIEISPIIIFLLLLSMDFD